MQKAKKQKIQITLPNGLCAHYSKQELGTLMGISYACVMDDYPHMFERENVTKCARKLGKMFAAVLSDSDFHLSK